MPDLEISKLPPLLGAGLAATDPLAIADLSASETKSVTAKELVQASMKLIDIGSIPGAKIESNSITSYEIGPDSIGASELANGSVDNLALQDNSITQTKLQNNSVGTAELLDANVTGAKLGTVTNRGLDQTGDLIGHTNAITSGTYAGLSYDAQGHVTAVPAGGLVPSGSLPPATDTTIGAVKPGTGLDVQGDGTLDHSNSITAGDIGGLQFDDQGHISGVPASGVFDPDALPKAGQLPAELGGVFVPPDPDVGIVVNDVTGKLSHDSSSVAAGTYAGVTVDGNGHVTAGTAQLTQLQLPAGLPANQITVDSGMLPTIPNTPDVGIAVQGLTEAISAGSISRRHLSNSSTAYIQETNPPQATSPTDQTVFRGCLWLKESTGQLFMYNGNSWRIVAGGKLAQENLRFCGTIDASNGNVIALTDEGTVEQLSDGSPAFGVGQPLPVCEDEISGCYFMVGKAGSAINVLDVVGTSFDLQDICLAISTASGWNRIAKAVGGGGGSAFWDRAGAAPDATLTPTNAADNLVLTLSEWLALPRNNSTAAPMGGEGSIRWNEIADVIEVYDGTGWQQFVLNSQLPWETIAAVDNADWGEPVLRPIVSGNDIATASGRDLVFARGTAADADDTGSETSNLTTATLSASRTWSLPDESGTLLTRDSAVSTADGLSIDCGTY